MGIVLALLSVLTAIAVGAVLKLTGEIFVPLVVAWFLTQISQPLIKMGQKLKLPHVLNVIVVFCAVFALCVYGIKFCTSQIIGSERLINFYGPKLNQLIYSILDTLEIPSESFSVVSLLIRYSRGISGGLLSFSSQLVMTMVFLLFMLLEVPLWDKKVDKAFTGASAARIQQAMAAISLQTSLYLGTMTFISFITALCVWGTLAVIGIEFAGGWGILAFLKLYPHSRPVYRHNTAGSHGHAAVFPHQHSSHTGALDFGQHTDNNRQYSCPENVWQPPGIKPGSDFVIPVVMGNDSWHSRGYPVGSHRIHHQNSLRECTVAQAHSRIDGHRARAG